MEKLKAILSRIDGKGYKAYKDIQGIYAGDRFKLYIDYVQGDPFAGPSRVRVQVAQSITKYGQSLSNPAHRLIALEDFLARQVARQLQSKKSNIGGSGKSGLITVDAPGQEILPRTAVKVTDKFTEVRLSVGLPAAGRKILGKKADQMLSQIVPQIILKALLSFNQKELDEHLKLADQQEAIRKYLKEHDYIAFIANGAILPRESGVSNRPLQSANLVPFQAPPSLEIEIPLPHRQPLKGMAIARGVTLIVGGGYHGKSTLLKGIERGIYNHIAGDGREYVLTDKTAYKIRAEDGRRVEKVNITPFINNLPLGMTTERFSSEDASGSTSQAANIMEALEIGAQVLLIDEDTSATNFMIRDARMQELVVTDKEPITPFVDKVRKLSEQYGVSTILVLGGSGDYFDVADRVIMLDEYRPKDVTQKAKNIVQNINNFRREEGGKAFGNITPRTILSQSFNATRSKREKVDTKGLSTIIYGRNQIDLSLVEQLVDPSQTRSIANMIYYLAKRYVNNQQNLNELIIKLYTDIEQKGLDIISPFSGQHPGDLALPRKLELAAAINRLRTLKVE